MTFLPLKQLDKKHSQLIMHSMVLTPVLCFVEESYFHKQVSGISSVSRESKGMSNWSL